MRGAARPAIGGALERTVPPNGLGAQVRATARPWLARSAQVHCRTLLRVDWNALWLASCSAFLGGAAPSLLPDCLKCRLKENLLPFSVFLEQVELVLEYRLHQLRILGAEGSELGDSLVGYKESEENWDEERAVCHEPQPLRSCGRFDA